MFWRKRKYPIYDHLNGFTFESAANFLGSRKALADPTLTNMATTMAAALATGARVAAILGSMRSLKGVNPDILMLDTLAWSCTTWRQAILVRYNEHPYEKGAYRAWLCSASVAATIKADRLDNFAPEIGVYWLDRWNEFRAMNMNTHESFGLLTYLLFTSKGHHKPMKRYPDTPPVLLDLDLGIESMPAQLECSQAILAGVDAYIELAKHMPDEDDG